MIDPRASAAVRPNDGKIHALGMIFDTEEQVNVECARRDRRAGRVLSIPELWIGIPREQRVNDYTLTTRPVQQKFAPVFDKEVEDDPNKFRSQTFKDAKAAAFGEQYESSKAYLKRMEREADEKIEREAALAADKVSPRRLAAQEYAHQMFLNIAHYPEVPLSLHDKVNNLQEQAKTPGSSLSYFAKLAAECAQQYREVLEARKTKANQAKLAAVTDFDDANVPVSEFGETGLAPGDKATRMRNADGVVSYDVVSPAGVVKASYTVDNVPQSIVEAAG